MIYMVLHPPNALKHACTAVFNNSKHFFGRYEQRSLILNLSNFTFSLCGVWIEDGGVEVGEVHLRMTHGLPVISPVHVLTGIHAQEKNANLGENAILPS